MVFHLWYYIWPPGTTPPFPVIYIQMTFLSGCLHHSPTIIYIIQLELEQYKWEKTFRNTIRAPCWLFLTQTWCRPYMKVLKHSFFLENMFVIISYQLKCRKLRHNPNLDQIQLQKHDGKRRGEHFPEVLELPQRQKVFLTVSLISEQLKAAVPGPERWRRKSKVSWDTIPYNAVKSFHFEVTSEFIRQLLLVRVGHCPGFCFFSEFVAHQPVLPSCRVI